MEEVDGVVGGVGIEGEHRAGVVLYGFEEVAELAVDIEEGAVGLGFGALLVTPSQARVLHNTLVLELELLHQRGEAAASDLGFDLVLLHLLLGRRNLFAPQVEPREVLDDGAAATPT